jgi:hypothetical protein
MCWFFLDSSGLLRTSFRRAEEPYRDEDAADEIDRMETLSRVEVPAIEDVPDEKMVPEPPELSDLFDLVDRCDAEPCDGLSYR